MSKPRLPLRRQCPRRHRWPDWPSRPMPNVRKSWARWRMSRAPSSASVRRWRCLRWRRGCRKSSTCVTLGRPERQMRSCWPCISAFLKWTCQRAWRRCRNTESSPTKKPQAFRPGAFSAYLVPRRHLNVNHNYLILCSIFSRFYWRDTWRDTRCLLLKTEELVSIIYNSDLSRDGQTWHPF